MVSTCKKTAEYLNSIETNLRTKDVIMGNIKVVVAGSVEFIKDGRNINLISAYDVYEFNDENLVEYFSSYCISKQN